MLLKIPALQPIYLHESISLENGTPKRNFRGIMLLSSQILHTHLTSFNLKSIDKLRLYMECMDILINKWMHQGILLGRNVLASLTRISCWVTGQCLQLSLWARTLRWISIPHYYLMRSLIFTQRNLGITFWTGRSQITVYLLLQNKGPKWPSQDRQDK